MGEVCNMITDHEHFQNRLNDISFENDETFILIFIVYDNVKKNDLKSSC